ncbi:MAG: L,D-transpeptidase family protein [Nitratireductor sp.]
MTAVHRKENIFWISESPTVSPTRHFTYPIPRLRNVPQHGAAGESAGGSIMIHGQWDGYGWLGWLMQNYDWTNGCIGLANRDIDEMWDMIGWNTPVEILP